MSDFENKYRTWHTYLSYLKSAIRLFTCLGVMIFADVSLLFALAFGLFIAEIIGIAEEWV
jgi:hypothetical protein